MSTIKHHTADQITADDATPERPHYAKVRQEGTATAMFSITCDEGWRVSIVCGDMYEWAADWLLSVLGRRPFAPETQP